MIWHWLALGVAILSNIGANIAFKQFITRAEFKPDMPVLLVAAQQPPLWIGLALGGVLVGGYLYALKGLPLSLAYTVSVSVSIIGVTAAGVLLFQELISIRSVLGIALVIAGLLLLTRV